MYRDDHILRSRLGLPASEGLNAAALDAIGEDVALSKTVRSLLVARNGSLVFERYYNGGGPQLANNLHSVTKGLTALIVGAAVQDGSIPSVDTSIADLLPEDLAAEPGAEGSPPSICSRCPRV